MATPMIKDKYPVLLQVQSFKVWIPVIFMFAQLAHKAMYYAGETIAPLKGYKPPFHFERGKNAYFLKILYTMQ